MNANACLLSVIEDIYDTTFDQTLWTHTLKRIIEYAGAQSAGLVTRSATGEIGIVHQVGVEPHFVQTYVDGYAQFDPSQAIRLCDVGKIQSTKDWLPVDEFRKGVFYQEWARPQGLEDAANVLLDRSADGFSHFSLMKSGCPVDDDWRRTLAPIIPHLLRAVLIGQVLHRQTGVVSPVAQVLDQLKAAVVLLDGSGNITHTNESGRDILHRRDFLRSEHGRLVAADPQANRVLRDAVTASILDRGAARSGSTTLPFIAHDGERFVGRLLPLTSGRRHQTGIACQATAVLFVSRASLDAAEASDIIRSFFSLTPAEARVLLKVVEFGGVSETARSLDVAESTVKTHLRRIFTKTDTKRQADLVKLVAGFASPVKN